MTPPRTEEVQSIHKLFLRSREMKSEKRKLMFDLKVSLSLSLSVFFSILLASYIIWSAVLDSSDVLLSYSITSLA